MATSKKWLLVASEWRGLSAVDLGRLDVVVPGPGTVGALRALEKTLDVAGVISTGFCGALNPALRVGDIVSWAQDSGSRAQFVCIDRVVVTAEEKQALREKSGASVVDMESSAVAKKAAEWGVPFRYVRAVSDTAEEDMPLDFNLYRDANGNFSRTRIALAALRRPFTVAPGLLRLDRNCKLAAKRLGEFLADCRF